MQQDIFGQLFLIAAMIGIFYFLLIRPQQQKMKQHRQMVEGLRRGDTVVTQGGIVGKIIKIVDDREAQVEIADGVRVKVMKYTLSDVVTKSDAPDTDKKTD